jgi:hypothetical protein
VQQPWPRKGSLAQKPSPRAKKPKPDTSAAIEKLLDGGASYCEELSIDLQKGGDAPFQWLCCSVIFSIGIAEQSTFRAAKGLLTSGLTDPKSVKEADMREKIDAVNSQGNVQRGVPISTVLGLCRMQRKLEVTPLFDVGSVRRASNRP